MIYQFGDCSLDTELFELRRSGQLVALEPQVFRLVAYLIENRSRVVTNKPWPLTARPWFTESASSASFIVAGLSRPGEAAVQVRAPAVRRLV